MKAEYHIRSYQPDPPKFSGTVIHHSYNKDFSPAGKRNSAA
jgi:hypothetical protein